MGERRNKWLKRTVEIVLFIALLLTVRAFVTRGAVSGPAPPMQGIALDGSPISLESLRGRPVLVHFWATWCPVCRLEHDSVQAISQDHAAITVATQSGGQEEVQDYLDEHELHFPVLLDDAGILADRFGVRGVPASFIIDGAGQIRFVEVGYTTELGLRARLWWSGRFMPVRHNGQDFAILEN